MKKIGAHTKKVLVAAEVAEWLGISVRSARRRIRAWKEGGRLHALPEPGHYGSQRFDAEDIKRCFVEDGGVEAQLTVTLDQAHLRKLVRALHLRPRGRRRSDLPGILVTSVRGLARAFDSAIPVVLAYEALVSELTTIVHDHERRELSRDDAWLELTETLDRIHARAAEYDDDDPAFNAVLALRYARRAGLIDGED